jgi:hypothetical protein
MPLPEGLDFGIRHELATSGLLKPFPDRRPCFLIERNDRRLLGHCEHRNRSGILVSRRELARPRDRLSKSFVM